MTDKYPMALFLLFFILFGVSPVFAQDNHGNDKGGHRHFDMGIVTNKTADYTAKVEETRADRFMLDARITVSGKPFWIAVGPSRYLESNNIQIKAGDTVQFTVFTVTNKDMKVDAIAKSLMVSGKKTDMMDSSGKPLWRGGGRKDWKGGGK